MGRFLDSSWGMICAGFLSPVDRADLTALARDGSAAHRLARRANALVLLDSGWSCEKVAEALMFQTSEPILYDLPATLHKWESLEVKRSGQSIGSMQIWEGTLAGCVREFMAKPISQRPLYDIFTDTQPGLTKTILESDDILALAAREDFPKS
jgi:hypothetical protein